MTLAEASAHVSEQDVMPEWLADLPRRTTPRALCLTGGVEGCLLWRIWWACAHASSHGFVADYVRYEDLNGLYPLIKTGRYNLVVTPRFVWHTREAADEWYQAVRNDGLAWVYEIDDNLWEPSIVQRQMALYPRNHPLHKPEQFEYERTERIRLVGQADAVTVTTDHLRTITEAYTPTPVHVVPNAIDVAWTRQVMRGVERTVPPLSIGWFGGQRQDDDLAAVGEAWSNLARRYPDLHFVVQGYPSPALTTGLPADRLEILPWATVETYPRSLVNYDIGCCSVSDDPWNLSKSNIKWQELTVAGAPCVVTPQVYGRTVVDGETALVAETAGEWEHALARLVESAELRRHLQTNAMAEVEAHWSMRTNWWRWIEAWSQAVERSGA